MIHSKKHQKGIGLSYIMRMNPKKITGNGVQDKLAWFGQNKMAVQLVQLKMKCKHCSYTFCFLDNPLKTTDRGRQRLTLCPFY